MLLWQHILNRQLLVITHFEEARSSWWPTQHKSTSKRGVAWAAIIKIVESPVLPEAPKPK